MAVDLLHALTHSDTKMTLEQAFDVAFNTTVWQADRWQERIRKGWENYEEANPPGGSNGPSLKNNDSRALYEMIQSWNRHSDPDSTGAMAYRAFKLGLGKEWANAVAPPPNLTDGKIVAALNAGATQLKADFGTLEVPYGRFFRVAREGASRTYPVGGGSLQDVGMATPRAIGFSPVGKEMVGRSGQTSTQVVVLSNPPKSWSIIPLGESDHKESGHWDDQAEKLFSKGKMKSTYFMDRKELERHVTSQKVLEFGK
jgi:acyl-homoserine lactone acylase PvdQ